MPGGSDADDLRAAGFELYGIIDDVDSDFVVSDKNETWCIFLYKRDGSVLQFCCGESFGVNVAYFMNLNRTFKSHGEIPALADNVTVLFFFQCLCEGFDAFEVSRVQHIINHGSCFKEQRLSFVKFPGECVGDQHQNS